MDRRSFLKTTALGGAAAASTTLAAPAYAQGKRTLTMVTSWGRGLAGVFDAAQYAADTITAMSGGDLTVEIKAAGELVGAFEVFDAVTAGQADMYHAADYYFISQHPGYAYFTAVPFGMTTAEQNAWVKFGGGQELWDELGSDFGVKGLLAGNTGTQAGGWFNKEINSPEDLQGLKMRIPGLGGNVMSKLGASTVSLPGGQIYENLVSGAIEATEWVGPYNDYFMKFYEAAKYYYTAGMHEPGSALALGMNAEWWGSLSDYERAVITAAAMEENAAQYEETVALNGVYLQKLIDEHGVEVKSFNDDVWDAFGEASEEVTDEVRDHSELAARVNDSYMDFIESAGSMMAQFEIAFVNQRNRVRGLGV